MPSFRYKAVTLKGESIRGVLEVEDRRQAIQKLKAQRVRPVSIVPIRAGKDGVAGYGEARGNSATSVNSKSSKSLFSRGFKFSFGSREKITLSFLKMLLQLHSSGMPLGDAVRLMRQRLSDEHQRSLANQLWHSLSEGSTLAQAMANLPEYFGESVIHLIEAGEATGNLIPILKEIVAFMEESAQMRSKIKGSFMYPILVTLLALGVAVFFIFFLLPKIQEMVDSLGGDMSLSARLLIGASNAAIVFGPFLVGGGVVAVLSLQQWRRSERGRECTDRWLLQLPLLGKIFRYIDLFQTSNLVGTLLSSGINTTEALRLTEKTIRNTELRSRFRLCRTQINEGVALSMSFRRNRLMSDLATDILSISENTGHLGNGLREITKYYRQELARSLQFMTNLISSLALIFAFSLVTLIALGIITSVFQVSNSLSF